MKIEAFLYSKNAAKAEAEDCLAEESKHVHKKEVSHMTTVLTITIY